MFAAVDAFTGFAFMLGVETEKSANAVLKNIYFLIEHPDFVKHLKAGVEFTLVLEEYEEWAERIENILRPAGGKLLFSKGFNNQLANPVLKSIRDSLVRDKLRR